jgi:hypothetical protein
VTKNPEEDEIAGFQKFMCANGIPEWKNEKILHLNNLFPDSLVGIVAFPTTQHCSLTF